MGRPKKYHVNLTDAEVKQLKAVIRNAKTSKTIRQRCQVIIDLDEAHGKSLTYEQTSRSNGVSATTVYSTVKLYCTEGLDSLITMKRNVNSDNARRKLDGRAEARLIEIACSPPPKGRARWTLRLLAEEAKVALEVPVGKDAIGRALKKQTSASQESILVHSRKGKC